MATAIILKKYSCLVERKASDYLLGINHGDLIEINEEVFWKKEYRSERKPNEKQNDLVRRMADQMKKDLVSGSFPPPPKRVERTFRSGFPSLSDSFKSHPPGLSKPWMAAPISHDDTSLVSPSEASLAFGSWCRETPDAMRTVSSSRRRAHTPTGKHTERNSDRLPPLFEAFASMDEVALAIMDRVYSSATLDCLNRGEGPIAQDVVVTIHDRDVTLSTEQCEAIAMGVGGFPITAIHAAFRTGKTVAGAITAA
ncbi:hypothetical protein RB195_021830 [Necator americanus]|uniref:SH3 domain-containing protein n=1 Tax=Necator americanus TaxID=51031 RepID=A0ABR1ECU6_NECAM